MKKSQTAIILFVALLSGCGVAANDPQTNNDNVPINNQINTPQTQTSQVETRRKIITIKPIRQKRNK